MASYTVHVPELSTGDIVSDSDRVAFVRDGFSWLALLFPFLWLLVHRLWIALLVYVALTVAANLWLPDQIAAVGLLAVNFILAFEGDALRRWFLGLRGYRTIDVVTGASRDDCERRFFERWDGHVGVDRRYMPAGSHGQAGQAPAAKPSREAPYRATADDDDVIGLFPSADAAR